MGGVDMPDFQIKALVVALISGDNFRLIPPNCMFICVNLVVLSWGKRKWTDTFSSHLGNYSDGLSGLWVTYLVPSSICKFFSPQRNYVEPAFLAAASKATLGGEKGRSVQYHSNISKDEGTVFYEKLITLCEETVQTNSTNLPDSPPKKVKHGTYGNRQVLNVETNGPFTHVFDF
ncbi:putative D-tyrosyl-tRNA(Tyr) deacylase 2 [Pocillopora verrucosa]|uniref:putative D-tyrosyl-tRNA(Tyr) deacylase 2 n=1 Tax=Pocillopora verrucosa TaxID=203993 RepID=UPI003342A89E